MPSFKPCLSRLLKSADLFPYSQFMRYNGQSEYTTATGGIVSVIILTVFVVLFASMGLKTIRKEMISSYQYSKNQVEPPFLNVEIGYQGVMVLINVFGFNLTATNKLFKISLLQQTYGIGYILQTQTNIPLVQCTEQHFNFTSDLASLHAKLNMSDALCPPLGQTLEVGGRMSSQVFKDFKFIVQRCNITADPNCYTDAQFNAIQQSVDQFFVEVPLIQTSINAGSDWYKRLYYEDEIFFSFRSTMGILNIAKIQEDIIETDTSIMPYQTILSQYITRVAGVTSKTFYQPTGTQPYAIVEFQKSSKTQTFTRSFNKLDTYFSYVGGLVGTILTFIFIMAHYTETAYQISLANKVFTDNNNDPIPSRSFSIGYYFSILVKKGLSLVGYEPNWPKTQLFEQSAEEASMQLDVSYLIRKINFLQAAIATLLQEYQLDVLCLRNKPSLQRVKEKRMKHFAVELINQAEKEQREKPIETDLSPKERLKVDQLPMDGLSDSVKSKQREEDVSAHQIKSNYIEVQRLKRAVLKVSRESRQGVGHSLKLMEDIDTSTLRKMGIKELKREGPKRGHLANTNNLAIVESIEDEQVQESTVELKESGTKFKRNNNN